MQSARNRLGHGVGLRLALWRAVAALLLCTATMSLPLAAQDQRLKPTQGDPEPTNPAVAPSTAPASAPAITTMAFGGTTLSGESVIFPNDYSGKLVLVSFWATWCPVCSREMPYWKAAEQRFRESNIAFVGVLTDQEGGSPRERAEAHVRKLGLAWPQVYEGGAALSHECLVASLPHSFLVDGDTGKVLVHGNALRKKRLMPQLEKALLAKFPGIVLPAPVPVATQPITTRPETRPLSNSPTTKPTASRPGVKYPRKQLQGTPVSQPASRP